MSKPFKKESKFVKALDEWFPCYPNKEVRVSVIQDAGTVFRVCVWGQDDFGMEKHFENRDAARDFYAEIPNLLSVELLKKLGFVRA